MKRVVAVWWVVYVVDCTRHSHAGSGRGKTSSLRLHTDWKMCARQREKENAPRNNETMKKNAARWLRLWWIVRCQPVNRWGEIWRMPVDVSCSALTSFVLIHVRSDCGRKVKRSLEPFGNFMFILRGENNFSPPNWSRHPISRRFSSVNQIFVLSTRSAIFM